MFQSITFKSQVRLKPSLFIKNYKNNFKCFFFPSSSFLNNKTYQCKYYSSSSLSDNNNLMRHHLPNDYKQRIVKKMSSNFHLIDGQKFAEEIKQNIKEKIAEIVKIQEEKGVSEVKVPGLAVILVGQRKDSQTYVASKKKTCVDLGMKSFEATFPDAENTTEEQVIETIKKFNEDDNIHGILIQLPLPSHMDEEKILSTVRLDKDVDGLSVTNIGRLAMRGREPNFIPCTPLGCLELLKRTASELNVKLEGLNAVVIGRSNIVGIPMSLLLLHRLNCTVQVLHSKSKDIPEKVRQADIVVACCGIAEYVQPDWLKEGSIVIDVGINAVTDETKKLGYRLVGDVKFNDELKQRVAACTPVPRGVGPCTIAMLMRNTFDSFKVKNPELF